MTFTHRWTFRFYNALLLLALPFIMIGVALRWRRRVFSKGFERWGERWGHLPDAWNFSNEKPASGEARQGQTWWWVHAVSLGEVKAIEPFLRRAPSTAGVRILFSAVTPEALAWAVEKNVAERIIAAPFDLPWTVRRVFTRVHPQLFVSVESEFWPNLLREARDSGARVALINGRISERSYRRYQWIRGIVGALWPLVDLFSVREPQDADRFAGLGVAAERLRVTGHLKYDRVSSDVGPAHSADTPPIIVMGSTREGEEKIMLSAVEALCARHPDVRIIWAPRHMHRVAEVEALLASRGLVSQRKSMLHWNGSGLASRSVLTAPHLLWDTLGDLIDAYQISDVAVVGGSFVAKGGQNPIEPAALKRPVIFGPSMTNFKDIAKHLVDEGGARQISVEELEKNLDELLETPALRQAMGERAQKAVQAEQGATDRTLALLKGLVHGG